MCPISIQNGHVVFCLALPPNMQLSREKNWLLLRRAQDRTTSVFTCLSEHFSGRLLAKYKTPLLSSTFNVLKYTTGRPKIYGPTNVAWIKEVSLWVSVVHMSAYFVHLLYHLKVAGAKCVLILHHPNILRSWKKYELEHCPVRNCNRTFSVGCPRNGPVRARVRFGTVLTCWYHRLSSFGSIQEHFLTWFPLKRQAGEMAVLI